MTIDDVISVEKSKKILNFVQQAAEAQAAAAAAATTTSDSESKENDKPNKDKPLIPNPEIDSLDDKPWQKPGADLSDYFNYGFER